MEKKRGDSSKKAEEALKESEEKLRFLLDNIPDLVMTVDRNHKILMVNHSMGDISAELATGTQLYNYLEHSHHKIVRKSLEKVFQTGKPQKYEALGFGPQGPNTARYETRVIPNKIGNKVVSVTLISLDVTERKRAEEELQKSEERLKFLVSSSPAIIYTSKAYGDYEGTFISENIFEQMGYKPKDFTKDSNFWANHIHPDDRRRVLDDLKQIFKIGYHIHEYRFKFKDGKYHWMKDESRLIKDEKGKPKEIIGYWADITEQKKAEEKIKLFSDAVNNSIDGIIITDLNGNITYCNEASTAMFGYKEKELMGKHVGVLDAEPGKAKKEITPSIKKTGGWSGEFLQKRKDGSVFPTSLTTSIIKDEKGIPLGMMGILRDITERKKAEEELENIFNLSPDMIAVCTTEGKFLKVSPSWERVLGYTQKELLKLGWAKLVHPDDVEHTNTEVEKQLKGNSIVNFVNRYKCKDGTYKILEWWATFSKEGIVHATARDITDRKKAEEELHTSHSNISAIIENTDDYILISDENARPIMFNSAYAKVMKETLGVDMKPGLQPHKLLPNKKMVAWWDSLHRRVLGGEKFRAVYSHEFKKGNIRHFEVSYHPIVKKGKVSGFTEFTRDITEQKKAEETLKESEEKYRSLIENIPDVIWTTDSKGNTPFISSNIKKVYGYTPKEIYKASDTLWFGRIHPDDIEKVKKAFELLFTKNKMFDIEYRIKGKDGEWIWLHDRAISTYKKDGAVYADGVFSDITGQKKTQEKLKLFSTAVAGTIDGIAIIDMGGIITYVNPATNKLFGYKERELIGKPVTVLNANPKEAEQIMSTMMKTGKWSGEVLSQKKNKEIIPTLLSISTIKDETGKPIAFIGINRDITERKKAEETLKESEEKFKFVSDNMQEGLWITDSGDKLTYFNKKMEEISGVKKQDAIGLSIVKDFPKETTEHFLPSYLKAKKTLKPTHYESKVVTPAGRKTIQAGWIIPKAGDGKYNGIVCTIEDVTEKKKTEELVNLQSELTKNMSEGVYLTGLEDFKIKYTNPAFEKMFGYNPGEMIGKGVSIVNAPIPGKTPKQVRDEITALLKKEKEWHGEVENIKKDGTHFFCRVNVSLFDHPDYGIVIVSVHTDITERKKAEQEREDYTAQLQEKTAELELMNAKLKEQMNMLERFRDATSDHIIEMKETEEENVKLKQEIDKLKKT